MLCSLVGGQISFWQHCNEGNLLDLEGRITKELLHKNWREGMRPDLYLSWAPVALLSKAKLDVLVGESNT
jgi:hypothetical protein